MLSNLPKIIKLLPSLILLTVIHRFAISHFNIYDEGKGMVIFMEVLSDHNQNEIYEEDRTIKSIFSKSH